MPEITHYDKQFLETAFQDALEQLPESEARSSLQLIFSMFQKMVEQEVAHSHEMAQQLEIFTRLSEVEVAQRLSELSPVHAEGERAKEQTAQSELLFRTMCEASPELIWTADSNGTAQYFNAQFLQFSGLSPQQLANNGWFNIIHGDDRDQVASSWKENVQSGDKFESEIRMKRCDGEYHWFLVRSLPIKNAAGEAKSWCGSCTDIDTHRSMVSELKLARDQAESALKVKTEFVANVSHELRTPLNGILGMVEVLLRGGDLRAVSKGHVTTIREAGDSLLSIINDILDFSKIEAGKMEVLSCKFDPLSVVEGVAEILVPHAAAKNLLLLATVDRAVPDMVYGDPQRLRQVLVNLCGNAIKFTDEGQIVIKVEVAKNDLGKAELLFSVCDSGIGISKQFQDKLFEPFMQAEGAAYRSTGGTGLGLSISKDLVDLMGGKLFVDSEQDFGSIFSFSLPLRTNTENSLSDFEERPWEVVYSDIKVLTLEPRHKNQSVICTHLSALGIAAETSDNAQAALDLLEAARRGPGKYQAVMLDRVRFNQQCVDFLNLYKKSSVFGLVNIIEVGAPESFSQARTTYLAPRTSQLAIPLRRKAVAACLDHLEGWQPKERTSDTQTVEVNCLPRDGINSAHAQRLDQPIDKSDEEGPVKRSFGTLRKALVADDNKINQQVASLFLQDMGFIVDLAADGIEAVSAFKSNSYDMIFLDCQMPGLDGYEACKIIKEIQQRRGQHIPIIAVTANAIAGSREECLAKGMDDYLSKPIDPVLMNKIVTRWLGATDFKITLIAPPRQDMTQPETFDMDNRLTSSFPMIDLAQLRMRFNTKNMHAIIRMFKDSCAQELKELALCIDSKDYDGLKFKAHALGGACSTICANHLSQGCLALERAAMEGNQAKARQNLQDFSTLFHRAEAEIESELLQQTTSG